MKIRFLFCAAVVSTLSLPLLAADVERVFEPERLLRGNLNIRPIQPIDAADWVWHPDGRSDDNGRFLHFRAEFETVIGRDLTFRVSADSGYILMLDGKIVSRGPDVGTPLNWFYRTYRIRLEEGRHVFDAVVWSYGRHAPAAGHFLRGGFIFQADDPYSTALTTGGDNWRVAELHGTKFGKPRFSMRTVGSQLLVDGTDILSEDVAEGAWARPLSVRPRITAHPFDSSRAKGWMLYPSQIPDQFSNRVSPGQFVAADEDAFDTNGVYCALADDVFSNGVFRAEAAIHPSLSTAASLLKGGHFVLGPHRRLRLLWDLGDYYCAYPEFHVRGGRGGRVSWGWAEALYEGNCFDGATLAQGNRRKGEGSRSSFIGRYFGGMTDVFLPDGREDGVFSVPVWRCGRWCLIQMETSDEALELSGLSISETHYPLSDVAEFYCDDPLIAPIARLCRRGFEMCMHETCIDCPYYERIMYAGDTRVLLLIANTMMSDDRLARQCFRLFETTARTDGMVAMGFTSSWQSESATYSMLWSCMLGDHVLWRGDREWTRVRLPAVRRMLFGLEPYVCNDGILRDLVGWPFVDWTERWKAGCAPGSRIGENGSSVVNLLYLHALQSAVLAETFVGESELAERWRRRAESLRHAIFAKFWNPVRGLLSDTPGGDSFSEHAQVLAITADALPSNAARQVFEGLVASKDLAPCTVYFMHYLFETYFAFGRADLFFRRLNTWRDFVSKDLKTPIEAPGDARSDCHGWGTHPIYHFQTGLAGIKPSAPGFTRVRVAPCPGHLKHIRSKMPHPLGAVITDLRFENGKVRGRVSLPNGVDGTFVWQANLLDLHPGENEVNVGVDRVTK